MGKDVVIIGGGIIGLCSAYYCALAGHKVTVVERGPADHNCCCRGNGGMIVPSHFVPLAAPGMVTMGLRMMVNSKSPFYIKPRPDWSLADWGMKFIAAATAERVAAASPVLRDLHLASRRLFMELSLDKQLSFGLKRNGLLMLCRTHETLHEESEMGAQARKLGIPAETLDADETAKLDESIEMDVAGAVYFPEDCHLDPSRFLSSLTQFLRNAGVSFRWNCNILDCCMSGGQVEVLTTEDGQIAGEEFVLAGGVHSTVLGKRMGIHLPMQAGKGYSVTVAKPPQLPKICSILTEARVAVTPIGRSLRFGGTMEMSGINFDITPKRIEGITESAAKYFPAFDAQHFAGLEAWSGLRPCSPDGLPYLGRTSEAGNLIVATGHAMLGLSLGPISGKSVAEMVDGETPPVDSVLLSPDRYNGF